MKINLSFENLLLVFFVFIGFLIACRIFYSGSFLFIFLVWNIFLAWIPYRLSYFLYGRPAESKWKQWLLFATWLLFFPNALYIITDLVHLDLETGVPKWFDAILLFTSAIVGLMMAFISLYRVEQFFKRLYYQRLLPYIMLGILFLGSFGVYLGRFLRWNSWDIIHHPIGLLSTVMQRIIFPLQYLQTWGITFLLTTLFYLLYSAVKKLPAYITKM
jgi:uncharacterized membrane protein